MSNDDSGQGREPTAIPVSGRWTGRRSADGRRGMRLYRLLVLLGVPLRRWCRLQVNGHEVLPSPDAPLLVVSNHDSMLDPLAIADTMVRAGRPVRFLAMARLWRHRPIAWVMDGTGQIPIRRGAADAAGLQAAIDALEAAEAVCIFPEGRLSRGANVRARSGAARLIHACPHTTVVLAAVSGGTDLVRFPRRPILKVELFAPRANPTGHSETNAELAQALLRQIRERVPPVAAGRSPHARDPDIQGPTPSRSQHPRRSSECPRLDSNQRPSD